MITTDQELNNPEPLQTIEPQLNQEQQATDIEIMQQPTEPLDVESGEQVASLSAWASRHILKTVKPVAKEVREKIHVVEKPSEDLAAGKLPTDIEETINNLASEKAIQDTGLQNPAEMIKRANDITNAELKNFKTTDSYQVNFDTIEGGEDVAATIAQMAEINKLEIDEARRGVITDEMLTGLANDLNQDPEFIKKFMLREQGTALNAETVLATRQLLEQSAVRLKTLADLVSTNSATDIDKANFAKQWQFHKQFNNQFMGMRAEFGRGLRAFGVNMQDMEQSKIGEVMGMVANDMDINKIASQISTMSDVKGINNLVVAQDSIYMKGTKVFVENFISSILSGVKTQIVNTSGAALRLGMDTPDTLVAALIGKVTPNNQEKIVGNEALAKIFGMVNGFQDAILTGWKVAKTTEPYGGIDKLDMLHQKAITSEYLGFQKDSVAGKIVDTYGTIIRAPLERVMGGVDGFFKIIGERSQLAGLAYRKMANSGLEGDEAKKYLNDLMANPTPDMIKEMEDFALDITFQKPLGEIGQAVQNVVHKMPALKIFLPFIKTPTNLMKQAYLERTPLGMFTEQYKADITAGGARADMARAKMVNGTMIAMSALGWAMNGSITGSNPKDNKIREMRQETGWRPRSFVFKNDDGTKEYISYDKAEPFSYLLGTVADIVEYNEQIMYDDPNTDEDEQLAEGITSLVAAFTVNTLDKSFMTGMSALMEAASDPKRHGKDYISNLVSASIPFAGLRRDIAKSADDLSKEAFTMVEKLKRGTPGFNSELPDRLDNYGDPVRFDTVLSPWSKVLETTDPVKLEIMRLAKDTRQVPVSRPRKEVEGVKLTADQYHNLIKYTRKEMLVNGLNYRDTLEEVINSEMYLDAPTDDARVLILNSITKKFDEAGRAWIMSTDEALYEKIQSKKEKKINKLLGGDK